MYKLLINQMKATEFIEEECKKRNIKLFEFLAQSGVSREVWHYWRLKNPKSLDQWFKLLSNLNKHDNNEQDNSNG